MIPSTYTATLLLALLAMICWGSWANTVKKCGKWRFELYCYDFALGLLLCALAASFSLGMFGSDITFYDNLTIVRKLQIGYAGLAGMAFALASILLIGAISIAGIAITFPLSLGLGLVVHLVWTSIDKPAGNPFLLFSGVGVTVAAVALAVMAYYIVHAHAKLSQPAPLPGRRPIPFPSAGVVIALGVVSGLFLGTLFPLLNWAKQGDIEMGSHAVGFIFAIAVFFTTLVLNLYFMNLPVRGSAISISAYFSGTARQHLWGILGGAVWYAGTISYLAAQTATGGAMVDPKLIHALGQGGTILASLSGLLIWKDLASAPAKARSQMWISILLTLAGIVFIYLA
ncbi:MAG: hypothetical protein JJE04_21785 [Acidobacteriia bacterium]|nr:hypothetical protein [Terriglobia bacterium]